MNCSVVVANNGGGVGSVNGQLTGSSSSSSGQLRTPLHKNSRSMHEPSSHVNSFSLHSIFIGRKACVGGKLCADESVQYIDDFREMSHFVCV